MTNHIGARSTFAFPTFSADVRRSLHKMNRISINPFTIFKMSSNDLARNKQTAARSAGVSEHDFNVIGIYIVGFVMIVIVTIACFRMVRICISRRRVTVMDPSDLPEDKTVHKTSKSTLAKRKQAILELFETSQVTMVSNNHTSMGQAESTQMNKLTVY